MPLKIFNRKKSAIRGRSTAFVVTVVVHVVLFLVAGSYVALTVLQREEPKFTGQKIERPKMKLKKLQVPIKVKKIRQPKFRQPNVPQKMASMDFEMPAMGGIKSGGFGGGGMGSLGFGMRFDSLFGGDSASGNELIGTFYDFKQSAGGMPNGMTTSRFRSVIRKFLESWREKDIEDFFKAPQKKNAICFVMPKMSAAKAPDAFGVGDIVQPKLWGIHYKGEITAPETGRYRFCGEGDDILVVRVNRKVVLDGCFPGFRHTMTDWRSDAPETGKFPLADQIMTYGDWVRLRKGQSVPIEIFISEPMGGFFSSHIFIEQEGKTYREVSVSPGKRGNDSYAGGSRPVLPIFKMAEIPDGLKEKIMKGGLERNVATFEGPVFGAGY